MKNYKQALKPKNGWAHADNESMCAAISQTIAMHCCLNEKVVYNWIRKHYGDDWKTVFAMRGKDFVPYYGLVGSILEDIKGE